MRDDKSYEFGLCFLQNAFCLKIRRARLLPAETLPVAYGKEKNGASILNLS